MVITTFTYSIYLGSSSSNADILYLMEGLVAFKTNSAFCIPGFFFFFWPYPWHAEVPWPGI